MPSNTLVGMVHCTTICDGQEGIPAMGVAEGAGTMP